MILPYLNTSLVQVGDEMKVGDRVIMSPMWKYEKAVGTILNVTKDYTVVRWDNINGDWHYTEEQTKRLELHHEA